MTTVANVVSEKIPKCSIWHPMGRIPDETDCTRYYQCIFVIPRLTFCPKIADKQTYFNPTLELCLWSEKSPCESTSPQPGSGTSPQPGPGTSPTPGTSISTTTIKNSDPPCPADIKYPDKRPDDCTDPNAVCNSPVKGDCKSYNKWDGETKIPMKCGDNLYYNTLINECDTKACPPC